MKHQERIKTMIFQGGRSVGVPGELRGYEAAHKMFGRLPWADLFAPSIAILTEGIKVTAHLGKITCRLPR